MAKRRAQRNNILAGAFLLACLAGAIMCIIILADLPSRLRQMNEYVVRFELNDGADGLDTGSPVKVGGQQSGRVLGWVFNTVDDRLVVDVRVGIRADLEFYEDAPALLVLPLLGSASAINLPSLGDGSRLAGPPQGGDARLAPGEVLKGRIAPPAFLTQAGYGPDQSSQIREIIERVHRATGDLESVVGSARERFDPAAERLQGILDDTSAVVGDARGAWPRWSEKADTILGNVDEASATGRDVMASMKEGVDGVVSRVTSAIDDNRAKIDETLTNMRDLSAKLNSETYEMVIASLDRAQKGLDSFSQAAERGASLLEEQAPQIRRALANARIASDQLKLTISDVRAAPWRLLQTPGRREWENELLYESVRTYAEAVSDLRATAAALEAISAREGEASEIDRRSMEQLADDLQVAFERYQQAERKFLELWLRPEGK